MNTYEYIVGATGDVGSATAKALLSKNESLTVVLHNSKKEVEWKRKGAKIAIADLNDSEIPGEVFSKGNKASVLNPPAAPSTDPVKTEKKSVASILQALENSSIEKIVAESTDGAQLREGIGDLWSAI